MTDDNDKEDRRKPRVDFWQMFVTLIAVIGGGVIQYGLFQRDQGMRDVKLDYLVNQVAEFAKDRYTKNDAAKDQALITSIIGDISDRIKNLEWRFNRQDDGGKKR